jgi:hypothetical protein
MPFHIDRFRGSPDVQAMHPAAKWGYLSLLAFQWQTADCTLPDDPLDLAAASGLGDDLWPVHSARILRKFPPLDIGGRRRNEVCFQEWSEAKRIFEARAAAARKTTQTRAPRRKPTVTVPISNGDRAVTDGIASRSAQKSERSADTITGTVTSTSTETKAKTSRAKKPREGPTKTELAEKRHAEFKALIFAEWKVWGNPLETPPWDVTEGTQLSMMLRANPQLGLEGMRRLLQHRGRSENVNLAARPSKWLRSITDFAKGPLDPYGKPKILNGHAPKPDNTLAMIQERNARAAAQVEAEARAN